MAHKFEARSDASYGLVPFDATTPALLEAGEDSLHVHVQAEDGGRLAHMRNVAART